MCCSDPEPLGAAWEGCAMIIINVNIKTISMTIVITVEPVVIEDINAIVVELVGKEGVRDKELANREGHNDGLDDQNDDHDGDHDGDHEFIHDGANREGHKEDLGDQNDDVDGDHEVLDDGVITGIVMMMTLMFRKPTI